MVSTPDSASKPDGTAVDLVRLLRDHRLLAIVRGSDPAAALQAVLVLAAEGLRLIEVSLTTPDAARVIGQARRELGPEVALGAGTVLTAADAARAADAGASYLVTPALGPGLGGRADNQMPVLMGALTPSEIVAAVRRGACAIKLFPASVGGPAYLRTLREPFPDVAFVPVGGITPQTAGSYLDSGAIALGVGSGLVADAASGGDLGELRSRAQGWQAAVAQGCA